MKAIKYFIIALLLVGCSKSDDTPQETDLSGIYRGTVLSTDLDDATSFVNPEVVVAKFSSQYIVTNYSDQWTINANGYGKYIWDDRNDPSRPPEFEDYGIYTQEVQITGDVMSLTRESRNYNLDGELLRALRVS